MRKENCYFLRQTVCIINEPFYLVSGMSVQARLLQRKRFPRVIYNIERKFCLVFVRLPVICMYNNTACDLKFLIILSYFVYLLLSSYFYFSTV